MKISNCPCCGAQVEFRSAAAIIAVCSYCRATVLRDGASAANLGKLSEIPSDYSPIQLSTCGTWKGRRFTVIGRLRLKYADGAWNEWSIEFQDGTSGWLSDASLQFVVMQKNAAVKPPADFEQFPPGRTLNVNQQKYTVTDARTCVCVGGEGELPGTAWDAKEFRSVDLRSVVGNGFISFDYSDVPASVYVGAACTRDELGFGNLRCDEEIERATGKLKGAVIGFECPSCGASLEYHAGFGQTVACSFCRAIVGLEGWRRTVLLKQQELDQRVPAIPLGSKAMLNMKHAQRHTHPPPLAGEGEGTGMAGFIIRGGNIAMPVRGDEYEAIGFMAQSDNEGSEWEEYILYSKAGGFLWLTHADGAWYLGEVLNSLPEERGDRVYHAGKLFRKVSLYRACTKFVLGEFNWQVKIGDEAEVTEWVSGNSNLSRETYPNEVTWTYSSKLPAAMLAKAFGLPQLPALPTTVKPGRIPWSWVLYASTGAFLMDVCAHLMGRGSIVALVIAVLALWYPKKYFEDK